MSLGQISQDTRRYGNEEKQPVSIPFLKWAGGKRWMTSKFAAYFPKNVSRHIEPFLGGGAAFFSITPSEAILSDKNVELIETYQCIRDDWRKIYELLAAHQKAHSQEHYYVVRSENSSDRFARAARFVYLNRTCWNGLYRVNRRGEFNVPIGTKTAVLLPTDNFPLTAQLLANAELRCGDFEPVIDDAEAGDFVFIDPPYVTRHNLNGFVKYNQQIFSWDDQIRLRDAVGRAAARGARILLTNADHHSIRNLYAGLGTHSSLERQTVLAAASRHRGTTSELAITFNYEPAQ